jgi:hypothetical protein
MPSHTYFFYVEVPAQIPHHQMYWSFLCFPIRKEKPSWCFMFLTPHICGPAYFNCPFHMRQISVLDKKKDDFFISLGTKPLMEMEDRIQYLRSYRPESKSNPFASN